MTEYDIGAAFRAIEEELIASMMRNMERHRAEETKEGIEWSQWQAEQLKALEKYKRDNQKKYNSQFKNINQEIDTIIRQARQVGNMQQEIRILQSIKKGYKVHGENKSSAHQAMTAEFFKLNDRKLEALITATTHDMEKAETAILRMANDQYRKAIFNAQVYANTGSGTYEKAVDMAVKDMLSHGLNCVEYANGARHTLADYADMAIRTASKRAYLTGEGEKRMEWGISTVIVNKRGNPCPKCLPFCGKVMIDDVWSGGKPEDGPYPLMSKAVAAGLYHPRCKDSHTTYFPGISTADDTWTEKELAAAGITLKRNTDRLEVFRQTEKYSRLARYVLDASNREQYNAKAQEWKNRIKSPEYLPVNNWTELNLDTMGRLDDEISYIPEIHMERLEMAGVTIEFIEEENSHYEFSSKTLYIRKNFADFEVIHEIAHAIEDIMDIWEDPRFRKLVETISEDHPATDIFSDDNTFKIPIRRLDDVRFVTEYQGRIYPDFGESIAGKVNPDSLWDYFSEGYRCFFEKPEVLLLKDPDLYAYIEELVYE